MVGKRDFRRHSTTNLSENVVVVGTSYQMKGVLSIFCWEGALSPFSTMKFSGVSSFWFFILIKFELILVLVLVCKSKAL